MSKFEDRQIILEKIKNGEYKNSGSSKTVHVASIIVAVLFSVVFIATATGLVISNARTDKDTVEIAQSVGMLLAFFVIILVATTLLLKFIGKGTKVTSKDLDLIANGLEIEARVEDIFGANGIYHIVCTSEKYPGQTFKSKNLFDRPIINEKRTARVFIDAQDPNQYFVDIYSIMPQQGEAVLLDRSELKRNKEMHMPMQVRSNVAVVFLCIFLMPFCFTALSLAISGIFSGKIMLFVVGAAVMALVVFGISKIFKTLSNAQNALSQGYYLEATGTRYWVTKSDNSTTHHFECRYVVPGTRKTYKFSTTSVDGRAEVLVGSKVRVYVNPENMNQYYVDAKYSLANFGFTANQDYIDKE